MDAYLKNRKGKTDDLPLCKYGLSCYQQNPEHRKKFKHPLAKNKVSDLKDVNMNSLCDTPKLDLLIASNDNATTSTEIKSSLDEINTDKVAASDVKIKKTPKKNEIKPSKANNCGETVEQILKSMPQDFFDFWKFCSSLNKSKPEDLFLDFGYKLVGVYDLLAKKLPSDKRVDISCHWRYYYDPPEFETVIKKNDKHKFHIGYFRDDPSEMPSILASNSAAVDSKLTLEGDNIFAAMNSELGKELKSMKSKDLKNKAAKIQEKMKTFAKLKGYELDVQTIKTKSRQKQVVAKTFHGLGIVVPVKNDIGYRPLPDSNATLKTILKKILSAKTEAQRIEFEETLDEIVTNVQFANDECDYGMGLELGIDIFCFGDESLHNYVLSLLPLAYKLLQRPKYAEIVVTHLKNRSKDPNLSTLAL